MIMEVLAGLSRKQKCIPPKFLYDKKGSEIFEEICELKEYYPTRAEKEILINHGKDIAALIGKDALFIEPGSGSGEKMKMLMEYLERPAGYVPIEISTEILERMTREYLEEFPELKVRPIPGDFTKEIHFPEDLVHAPKKVIFFPGSTIGNFNPKEAVEFLRRYVKIMGPRGGFLIGADLKKDPKRLVLAYDDPKGVTAAFNLNLLHRLNREVNATFEFQNFFHRAIYNQSLSRIEMHLVSRVPQYVKINQTIFRFNEGESIHTESSYKYSVEEFAELCSKADLNLKKTWQDNEKLFCVYYFEKHNRS